MELFGETKDFIRSRYFWLRERLYPSRYDCAKDIPIIINSFNRLNTLKLLISSLEQRGATNIHILDNCSTYPPLVTWLDSTPYEVIHLPKNLGFKALWRHKPSRKRFCNDYYIYTDADLMLDEKCPGDIIERMFDLLKNKYPYAFKIGPSIRIDNLPDCYNRKKEVIEWESKFFHNPVSDSLFRAPIDTTFALYRPGIGLSRRASLESYRMAAPYQIIHLPWYENSSSLTEEELYYKEHCCYATSWGGRR